MGGQRPYQSQDGLGTPSIPSMGHRGYFGQTRRERSQTLQDAMYTALAKVHETTNGSKLRIKVPKDIVDNISYSFARARMLNPELAKRTESFFVEWPNQLFTVAVPTDFELKDAWASQGNSKYAFYHKTDWSNVPN